jgi:hypothetical protein
LWHSLHAKALRRFPLVTCTRCAPTPDAVVAVFPFESKLTWPAVTDEIPGAAEIEPDATPFAAKSPWHAVHPARSVVAAPFTCVVTALPVTAAAPYPTPWHAWQFALFGW